MCFFLFVPSPVFLGGISKSSNLSLGMGKKSKRKKEKLFIAGPKRGRPTGGFSIFVCPSLRLSPFGLVVSYMANIPQTPNIFTDSGPSIKLDKIGLVDNRPFTK